MYIESISHKAASTLKSTAAGLKTLFSTLFRWKISSTMTDTYLNGLAKQRVNSGLRQPYIATRIELDSLLPIRAIVNKSLFRDDSFKFALMVLFQFDTLARISNVIGIYSVTIQNFKTENGLSFFPRCEGVVKYVEFHG